MMSWDAKSKWIWVNEKNECDTYGEFVSDFSYEKGKTVLKISVDSNYELYINGEFVNSGQYADFPHYKVYDEFDVTEFCRKGKNRIAIIVWYFGEKSFTYSVGNAALRYELCDESGLLSYSDENVLSRLSKTYRNGLKKLITSQLGFGFSYDASKEDDWKTGELKDFSESYIVSQDLKLFKRTNKKLIIAPKAESKLIKKEKGYYLFDLGREEVGYLTLKVCSEIKQNITVCYGEHIKDGGVRYKIGGRDFSFDITVPAGETGYTNRFRRLGGRYLEIHSEAEIEVLHLSLLPCFYPLDIYKKTFKNELHQKIYDVSVRTLTLCMHEHYEDCPWREQGLYSMDSRNQMLCGYYAFGEYEFPRNNLYLMSKDSRSDGLLPICTPTDWDMVIPSFVLHYFTQVYEYTKYSKDLTLIKEILPKLTSIIKVFTDRISDGLIKNFPQEYYWNFYEWTDKMDGSPHEITKNATDTALNCLLVIALLNMQKICDLLGEKAEYQKLAIEINKKINEKLFDAKKGLYVNSLGTEDISELNNALAILCGAAVGKRAKEICEKLVCENSEITKASLSMVCFKYDALIKTDKEKYAPFIIKSIEKTYQAMLDEDATSFWETEKGESDFSNAGSLCHGWSAMPVYYFNILGEFLN